MGVSTDGIICYGMMFDEGDEFPWDAEPWNGDMNDWWRDINGYKPPFEIYNAQGNYIDGVKPPQGKEDEYWEHRKNWDKQNPMPAIELVNYCSYDYSMYILASASTIKRCACGYPEKLEMPDCVTIDAEEHEQLLTDFCEKYGIETKEVWWYLASFWG